MPLVLMVLSLHFSCCLPPTAQSQHQILERYTEKGNFPALSDTKVFHQRHLLNPCLGLALSGGSADGDLKGHEWSLGAH